MDVRGKGLFIALESPYGRGYNPDRGMKGEECVPENKHIVYVVKTIRQAKRIIVIVVGFTVLLIGIFMIFLPGPGLVVIPLGLLILASELAWAKVLLSQVKERINSMKNSKNENRKKNSRT